MDKATKEAGQLSLHRRWSLEDCQKEAGLWPSGNVAFDTELGEFDIPSSPNSATVTVRAGQVEGARLRRGPSYPLALNDSH